MRHKKFTLLNPTKSVRSNLTGLKLSVVLLLGLGLTGLHAQEAIPAAGGNASGSGGSVSYSVGQVVYTTNTGTNGSVAQGVQQNYAISITTGLDAKGINLEYTAYPNPTTDNLTLKVENHENRDLSYLLYNMNGKLLESKKLTGNKTTITMENLVPAAYFLKIINYQKGIKTFKIIKN